MVTIETKETICPNPTCGYKMDRITGPRLPHAGDFSVCMQCGVLLVMTEDYSYRLISESEFQTFPKELRSELERVQKIVMREKVR